MANKILLADDSITIQKVVNLTFTDEGINVVTVGNGELALKKLGEENFDLVLADIFMPGRNGYEVCEYVKSAPATKDIPVILLVGAFEPFDKSEAARVRADGHLTKPFESRILIETVKRMLAEAAVKTAAAAPSPEPAYKGQVVGWDVPTSPMVPQHLEEEEEPEPPPYDPYASTAKLPPIPRPVGSYTEASEPPETTMNFGAPAPSGHFAAGDAAPPANLFELPPEPAPEPTPPTRAIEGPPDMVAGFSFATDDDTGSSSPVDESSDDRPSIGYQQIPATDSPLDLPDITIVDQHAHEPTSVDERRDPLLETFADVAESTASVGANADPSLEVNAHEEGESSMSVGAVEGIVSAWDREAQPEAPAEESAIAEPGPAGDEVWQTQAFSVEAAPFGLAEDVAPEASADSAEVESEAAASIEEPGESSEAERGPSKSTVGLAGAVGFGTVVGLSALRGGNQTERLTPEEFELMTGGAEEAAPAWEPEIEAAAEEAAPAAEASTIDAVEAEAAEASEPEASVQAEAHAAEAAAPVNGAGAPHGIPQDVFEEVVRRTMERLNDDVIREIAWEVVPELAENLIRKRLGEGR